MERLNHPYYKETSGLYKYDYQAEPKYEGYCMDDYIGAFIVWIILSVIILFIGIFTWFLEYDVGHIYKWSAFFYYCRRVHVSRESLSKSIF